MSHKEEREHCYSPWAGIESEHGIVLDVSKATADDTLDTELIVKAIQALAGPGEMRPTSKGNIRREAGLQWSAVCLIIDLIYGNGDPTAPIAATKVPNVRRLNSECLAALREMIPGVEGSGEYELDKTWTATKIRKALAIAGFAPRSTPTDQGGTWESMTRDYVVVVEKTKNGFDVTVGKFDGSDF